MLDLVISVYVGWIFLLHKSVGPENNVNGSHSFIFERVFSFAVPREEGNKAAHQLGCLFFELSASEELESVCAAFSHILERVRRRKHRWQPSVKKVNSLPRTKKTNVRYLNVFSKLKHDKKRQLSLK